MSDRTDIAAAHAAAPGTVSGLHAALMVRLAALAAGFQLLETKSNVRPPSVVGGWLPPKTTDVEQFPFLIVRPRSGVDSEQGADQDARATLQIIVGTLSDTDDGWVDVLLLIDAIRADLGAQPSITGTGYEQTGPLTWEIPEQQPRPQWFGTITTNWTLPRPQRAEARNPQEG